MRNDLGTYVSPRAGDLRMVVARVDFLRQTIILFSYRITLMPKPVPGHTIGNKGRDVGQDSLLGLFPYILK